ncbi:chitin deacetylase [Cladochytrium tenue]|nr:chitin deacetylase [Cladochytrium tenue]
MACRVDAGPGSRRVGSAAASLLALALLAAAVPTPALAYDFSWAPPLDKIAPTNAAWTTAFLGSSGSNTNGSALAAALAGAPRQLGHVVDHSSARVYALSPTRRDARMQRRRDTLPGVFDGNDVTEASGYVDWKWCDAKESSDTWGLAYLKSKHLTATFFTIGSRIMSNPDIMLRAYSEGHQIGIHTWSHPHLTTLTNAQIVAEVVYGAMAIKSVIGKVPKYIRPPCKTLATYGDIDDRVRGVLKAMGLRVVIWGVESHDSDAGANLTSVAAAVSSWGSDADDRAISIEHDLFDYQAEASVAAVDSLLSFGRDPVPIAECIGEGLSDSYDVTPLSQFFDNGYFDGKKATSTLSASASATSSALNSSATSSSASSLGMNKGGNTSTVTETSSSSLATSTATLGATSDASSFSNLSLLGMMVASLAVTTGLLIVG